MKMRNLHDLYVDHLKDMLNAENQVLKALPKMAKAASDPKLKQGFEEHLAQTKHQVERLKGIFEEMGEKPVGKQCKGMEGLIEEGNELMMENAEPAVKDAALIASAQKVEHYEISAYGTARTFAQRLGFNKAARVLQEILEEERMTDEKLTAIAESDVNVDAQR